MNHPTIALCSILKNEVKNLPRLLESVSGCFDAIYLTDTGSTDGSIEWIKENASRVAGCPVHLSHFEWVESFAKARNFNFSQAKEEYVMWLDLDDSLSSKDGFVQWKKYAMEFADYWLNTYNYALDGAGKPIVSFVRERVFKRSLNPQWRYDIHEGVTPQKGWQADYAVSWCVNHLRDAQDVIADKSRNIKLMEKMEHKDARMLFYYGKELYEANQSAKAVDIFEQVLKRDDLEMHDRILAHQYAGYAATQCGDELKDDLVAKKHEYYTKSIKFHNDGIVFDPHRAEFHCGVGDNYLKMGNLGACIPHYAAAKACINQKMNGSPYEGAIYSFMNCYGEIPSLQLAKVYFNVGKMDEALKEAKECVEKYNNEEAKFIVGEALKVKELIDVNSPKTQTEDIVFTCPPQSAYPFDEELYKTKGMGGSETALIEMSMWLKKLTGRNVIVYNNREADLVGDSGVEWRSNRKLNEYFSKNKPFVHIAWRHNIKLTNAKTYLWCHDLVTSTVEGVKNFDKILCLTEFHKNYVMAKQGVPEDMIIVTRNGINPGKFGATPKANKKPHKFVFMSSPDRGLRAAMRICDMLLADMPDLELHTFYGRNNFEKYGRLEEGKELDQMILARPYVKDHGFTEQNKMYEICSDASVWPHCATWIETSCITAMEVLALGIYPVTRKFGGLMDTLKEAESKGQATLFEHGGLTPWEITDDTIKMYADEIRKVVQEKKWENVDYDLNKNSWQSVAQSWVGMMGL